VEIVIQFYLQGFSNGTLLFEDDLRAQHYTPGAYRAALAQFQTIADDLDIVRDADVASELNFPSFNDAMRANSYRVGGLQAIGLYLLVEVAHNFK
jgi:hypothetical protein